MADSILAITTVGVPGGLCLQKEEETYTRSFELRGTRYSQILLSEIQAVLEQAKVSFSEIDGISVCTGPGSFTGIRVGMAVARSLAYANQLPIVGVSAFDALALAHRKEGEGLGLLLDARRGEVYSCIVAPTDPLQGHPSDALSPEDVGNALQAHAKNHPIRIVGGGVPLYGAAWLELEGVVLASMDHSVRPEVIAKLGLLHLNQNAAGQGLNEVLPVYIRRAV